jgi:DNA-binding NarL/FixJ family response regulator
MDMQYRILWFDDQPTQVDGYKKAIEAHLNTIGFTLKIRLIESFDEKTIEQILKQLKEHNPYDLIMVDYDLGKGSGGERLLKRLRFVSSGDMVFYSGATVDTLRNKLLEQKVDGIFCFGRTTLGNDVIPIIQNTLRRVIHPNYMRGLVVGSVAEMDSLFGEIIMAILNLSNMPSEQEIKTQLKGKTENYLAQQQQDLESFESKKLNRIIKKESLHTKVDLLLQLLEKESGHTAQNYLMYVEKFLDEINQHRINFAHDCTEENDDGIPIFKDRTGKIWTPERMKQLLLKIREHKLATKNAHEHFVKK